MEAQQPQQTLNTRSIGEALPIIEHLLNAGVNVCLEGNTGVGKTSGTEQLGLKMGFAAVFILRLDQITEVDVRGFVAPDPSDGTMVWHPMKALARASRERCLIILDEFNRAQQSTRNAAMQLLDGRIGDLALHPETRFVACINPTKGISGGGTTKLTQAEEARFTTINVVPKFEDWFRWATTHNIHPIVLGFLKSRPEFLERPVKEGKGVNPRAWEKISNMLWEGLADDDLLCSVVGTAGMETAVPFYAFYRAYKSMPDVDRILMQPDSADVPAESGIRYAVAASLASRATDRNIGRVITYLGRVGREYLRFAVVAATGRDKDLCTTPEYLKYIADGNLQ